MVQHTLLQSAHSLDILNWGISNVNLHIVEVQRSTLSVKATYGSLEITLMDYVNEMIATGIASKTKRERKPLA